MAQNEKVKKCSSFEEMLMWTSYRYCIGRHTYVTTMAYDIGKNYYDKLSDERREFTANDIRNEIDNQFTFQPFNFGYDGIYGNERNALSDFMNFINTYDIKSVDELMTYKSIRCVKDYDTSQKKWETAKIDGPVINKHYFSVSEIDDLIPWSDLAEYFDTKSHKIVNGIECYKSYVKKFKRCEDREGYYQSLPFGWEQVWKPCSSFGEYNGYILESEIKTMEDYVA